MLPEDQNVGSDFITYNTLQISMFDGQLLTTLNMRSTRQPIQQNHSIF